MWNPWTAAAGGPPSSAAAAWSGTRRGGKDSSEAAVPPRGGQLRTIRAWNWRPWLFMLGQSPTLPPCFHISITKSANSFYFLQGASGVAQPFSFPDSLICDMVTLRLQRIGDHVWILRNVNLLFKIKGAGKWPVTAWPEEKPPTLSTAPVFHNETALSDLTFMLHNRPKHHAISSFA